MSLLAVSNVQWSLLTVSNVHRVSIKVSIVHWIMFNEYYSQWVMFTEKLKVSNVHWETQSEYSSLITTHHLGKYFFRFLIACGHSTPYHFCHKSRELLVTTYVMSWISCINSHPSWVSNVLLDNYAILSYLPLASRANVKYLTLYTDLWTM